MFDFEKYWSLVYHFFAGNMLITAGAVVVLVFFFYRQPVGTIKFLGFCALLVAVLYVMSLLTESGSQGVIQKREGATKSEMELNR